MLPERQKVSLSHNIQVSEIMFLIMLKDGVQNVNETLLHYLEWRKREDKRMQNNSINNKCNAVICSDGLYNQEMNQLQLFI